MMSASSTNDLKQFSFTKCLTEFEQKIPTFTRIIKGGCHRTYSYERKTITESSLEVPIASIIGKCLSLYSQRLSAMNHINALLISDGGMRQYSLHRQFRLYNTVHFQTAEKKLTEMSEHHLDPIKQWEEENSTYTIVFDNVNKHVKRRQQTSTQTNKMYNMTNTIAVKDRATVSSLSSKAKHKIDELQPLDPLPNDTDQQLIHTLFTSIIRNLWAKHIPDVKWMETSSTPHKYYMTANGKTDMVSLGVQLLDESKPEDMLKLLQQYQNLVKSNRITGELVHKTVAGDWLSFAVGKKVQETQASALSKEERLEGIIMTMSDFHTQMNLVNLIYKVLYSKDSARNVGTLKHAISLLGVTGINSEKPGSTYYTSSTVFDKLFTSYVIAGGLELFKMKSVKDQCPLDSEKRSSRMAYEIAADFLHNLVELKAPTEGDQQIFEKRCVHCQKHYSTVSLLIKHHESKHANQDALTPPAQDSVYEYTKTVITLGLFRFAHNQCIRNADGEHIMMLYKFMMLLCKSENLKNYATGLMETVFQQLVLPEKIAESIKWNRFAKTQGRSDTNFPLDLLLEHDNRRFKDQLVNYQGKITQSHLDKISNSSTVRNCIIETMDKDISHYHHTLGDNRTLDNEDLELLTSIIKTKDIFKKQQAFRIHNVALSYKSINPLLTLNNQEIME